MLTRPLQVNKAHPRWACFYISSCHRPL